jgi:hypothetical protein
MEADLGAFENNPGALAALTGAVEVHAGAVEALPGLWKHTESHEGLYWNCRESPWSSEDSHWSREGSGWSFGSSFGSKGCSHFYKKRLILEL